MEAELEAGSTIARLNEHDASLGPGCLGVVGVGVAEREIGREGGAKVSHGKGLSFVGIVA